MNPIFWLPRQIEPPHHGPPVERLTHVPDASLFYWLIFMLVLLPPLVLLIEWLRKQH